MSDEQFLEIFREGIRQGYADRRIAQEAKRLSEKLTPILQHFSLGSFIIVFWAVITMAMENRDAKQRIVLPS